MRASSWVFLLRAGALIALGTSVALLSDYVRPDPSFCSADSGCGAVRQSGFGYVPFFGLGVLPMPAVGALAFALLFTSTMLPDLALRKRVVLPLALCAGALGLALVGLQALIGHFCSLCLLVDSSAVACALAAFSLRKVEWPADEGEAKGGLSMPLGAWLALSTLSVAAPAFFPLLVQTSPVPGVIRALYADKGVTVVEFFDYQCPHCRDLSPRLKKVAEQEGATLRFGYTPLPGHVFARAAARASICAAEQGKEAEVTAHFFASSIGAEKDATEAAARLVPDAQAFEQCLASARPDERIQKDTHAIQTAEFVGLPTTYIGGTRILGAQGDAMYRDAILRARQGSDTGGLKPWTYWLATVALVLAIILLGRKKAEMGAVRA